MNETLPPFDLDAEEALLGSCLIDSERVASLEITSKEFFSEQNKLVFDAILKAGEGANQITVGHELANIGKLEEAGGLAYLSHLVNIVPTSLHSLYYEEIVRKCAFNRMSIDVAAKINLIGQANNDPQVAMEKINGLIKGLAGGVKDNSILHPGEVADSAFNYYTDQAAPPFIETGIKSFDVKKGGYLPGEYVLLAARTTIGKTTIALQEACFMAATLPTLFFSLEMSKQQVTNKNIARIVGIDEEIVSLKRYSEEQREFILQAVGELSQLKLYIAEGNRSIDSIRRVIDRQGSSVGCGAVFIDYLTRIQDRLSDKEHLRVTRISRQLADLAKEYRIPFVVLHQFSREIESRQDKRPQLSDCREGGEEDADLVIMPYRPENNPFRAEFWITKDRLRGKTGRIEVNYYQGRYS